MKPLYEWGIPSIGLFFWIVLTFIIVPFLVRYLKRKAEETQSTFKEFLASVLGLPLILFLIGIGLDIFLDTIPSIPSKWAKYSNALLIIFFVLAGYLFLDGLMGEALRRYRKRIDAVTSSIGVMKTLYRSVILIFILLIVLDRLKITITPFIASLGSEDW